MSTPSLSMRKRSLNLLPVVVLLLVGLAVLTDPGSAQPPKANTLPVFRLAAPKVDPQGVQKVANKVMGLKEVEVKPSAAKNRLIARSGQKAVDVHRPSGAVWAANYARLWNPEAKVSLPTEAKARAVAEKFLKESGQMPPAKPQVAGMKMASARR